MRRSIALALFGMSTFIPSPTERDVAIAVIVRSVEMAERTRPQWWRWTCWLAGAITVRRFGGML